MRGEEGGWGGSVPPRSVYRRSGCAPFFGPTESCGCFASWSCGATFTKCRCCFRGDGRRFNFVAPTHAPSAHFCTAELPGSVAHRLLPNTTSPPPPPPVPPLPRPSLVIDAPHRHTIRAGLLHSWFIFRIYFTFGGAFLEIKRNLAKFFLSLFFLLPSLRAQTRPTPSLPLMVANREGWCLWRRGEFFGQTRR